MAEIEQIKEKQMSIKEEKQIQEVDLEDVKTTVPDRNISVIYPELFHKAIEIQNLVEVSDDTKKQIEKQNPLLNPQRTFTGKIRAPIDSFIKGEESIKDSKLKKPYYFELDESEYLFEEYTINKKYDHRLDPVIDILEKVLNFSMHFDERDRSGMFTDDPVKFVLEYKYYFFYQNEKNQTHLILIAPITNSLTLKVRNVRDSELTPNPARCHAFLSQVRQGMQFLEEEAKIYTSKVGKHPFLPKINCISPRGIWCHTNNHFQVALFAPYLIDNVEELRTQLKYPHKDSFTFVSLAFIGLDYLFAEKPSKQATKDDDDEEDEEKAYILTYENFENKLDTTTKFGKTFNSEFQHCSEYILELVRNPTSAVDAPLDLLMRAEFQNLFNYTLLHQLIETQVNLKRRLMDQNYKEEEFKSPPDVDFMKHASIIENFLTKDCGFKVKPGKEKDHMIFDMPLKQTDISGFVDNQNENQMTIEILPYWSKFFLDIKAYVDPITCSIEFGDDLNFFLNKVCKKMEFIAAEIDSSRRVVFRVTITLHPGEDILKDVFNTVDLLILTTLILSRKLNYCIEDEKFGHLSKASNTILAEIRETLRQYQRTWNNMNKTFFNYES